ncbi:MAG: sigma-70 family RNA polymerase sigma factor [Rubrobacter sp.]|nr:sigma-70 family RNA polymerase sigma factor [Rubrobacter sp.]
MTVSLKDRGNEQWLTQLRGAGRDRAIADLRVLLLRGLEAALHGRTGGMDSSLEDFAQEALIKILDNLDSFRGECRFVIWAQKFAIRTAFAELQRSRWRDISLDEAIERRVHDEPADALEDPSRAATRSMFMAQFRRFVDEELTEKQRRALLAAMNGMPLEAVADRMNTNRNALYKVLHDARKRLKRRMLAERFLFQDVLSAFEGQDPDATPDFRYRAGEPRIDCSTRKSSKQ